MHKRNRTPLLLIWLLFGLQLVSCCVNSSSKSQNNTLFDVISENDKLSILMQKIKENNLTCHFKQLKASTVFAPNNEAFESKDVMVYNKKPLKVTAQQILYHIIPKSIKSNELKDGLILETHSVIKKLRQFIKVFVSSLGDILIGTGVGSNGAKIVEANIEADNGVVHIVNEILTLPGSIEDTLGLDPEIEEFDQLAKRCSIDDDLQGKDGYTIFATKGSVFGDELSEVEQRYLNSKEGVSDLKRILKHQIVPNIHYSNDLKVGKKMVKTLEGSEDLEIDENGGYVTVNGVNIVKSDILASNGVIHIVDSPILPKKNFLKLNPREVLITMGATTFVKLFDDNGLGKYLDNTDSEDITFLVPSNDAMNDTEIPKKHIKTWLKYHLVQGHYLLDNLVNRQLLETKSKHNLGDKHYQRVPVSTTEQKFYNRKRNGYFDMFKSSCTCNKYSLEKTIQFGNSDILKGPIYAGENQVIYSISRSLDLPRESLAVIPTIPELSNFVASIYASETDKMIKQKHGITIFAPTNKAFGRLGLVAGHLLQPESQEKLMQVVKYHVAVDVLYENSTYLGEHTVDTLTDSNIKLNKTEDGLFVQGSGAIDNSDRLVIAKVCKTDFLTDNGVIHTIDRVQLPSNLKISNLDILESEGASQLLELFEMSNLTKEVLEGNKPYTILAPTDSALAKINLESFKTDPEKLLELLKVHVIPHRIPPLDITSIKDSWLTLSQKPKDGYSHNGEYIGDDYPTMLEDTELVISKNMGSGFTINIKNSLQEGAEIIDLGRTSYGGGVLKINSVMVPYRDLDEGGMRWWVIGMIVFASIAALILLTVGLYYLWGWYQSRGEGFFNIAD